MEFQGEQVTIDLSQKYLNGRTAIQLISVEDNMPYCVATVNVDVPLEENEVAIKDYSENEGMLDFLIANKVVEDTGKRTESGWVKIPICKLIWDSSLS